MKFETKKKIKKYFKERMKHLISGGIFLLIGGIVMLIGFSVNGWSLIQWLHSPWAVTTFIFLIGGLFILILAFIWKKQADAFK